MVKAIIFDCFGVLAEDGWMPIKRKYVQTNSVMEQDIADLGKQNEYGFIDNVTHLTKMADLMQVDRAILGRALNTRVPNQELLDYIATRLKPHYKIGLLSNANYDVLGDLFSPEHVKLIDASVLSYESRLIKPDRRMFKLMAERLDVEIQDCVFIDDQERYCVAAEALGMRAIYFRSNKQCERDLTAILNG